jgi:hypothetical protein
VVCEFQINEGFGSGWFLQRLNILQGEAHGLKHFQIAFDVAQKAAGSEACRFVVGEMRSG